MRLTIKREEFLKGLSIASRAVASKVAVAVLANLKIDLNENGWILRDDAQRQQIDSPLEHNSGIEVMFFYEGIATNKNFNKVKEMSFNSAKNMNTMIYNPCMNNNNNNNISYIFRTPKQYSFF